MPIILCNAFVLWVRVTSRNRVCFDGSHVILYARPPQTIRQRRRTGSGKTAASQPYGDWACGLAAWSDADSGLDWESGKTKACR